MVDLLNLPLAIASTVIGVVDCALTNFSGRLKDLGTSSSLMTGEVGVGIEDLGLFRTWSTLSECTLRQMIRPSESNSWASLPVDMDRVTNGRFFFVVTGGYRDDGCWYGGA